MLFASSVAELSMPAWQTEVRNISYQKEKTNSGYKHNSTVSHGMFNLTFPMLQHTSSEVTVTKSDEI